LKFPPSGQDRTDTCPRTGLVRTGKKILKFACLKTGQDRNFLILCRPLPVKSRKIDRKIEFFEIIFEEQNSLQDSLKTLIPILSFEIPYFKSSIIILSDCIKSEAFLIRTKRPQINDQFDSKAFKLFLNNIEIK
jgi:hypothetical protein